MRSAIILEKEKSIYICVKMEEVFQGLESRQRAKLADKEPVFEHGKHHGFKQWWTTNLNDPSIFFGIGDLVKTYSDYTWFFDFEDITTIHYNAFNLLCDAMKNVGQKTLINADELDKMDDFVAKGFTVDVDKENDNYIQVFGMELISFISKYCLIEKVDIPTGEIISNYINLKVAFENSDIVNKISFILAQKVYRRLAKNDDIGLFSLFCHSLNGACLAEKMSSLLGIDVVYADRLSATGEVRKLFMASQFDHSNKCIVVIDLICQGHEMHRARDIVMMLGGEVIDCVGVIDVGIHKAINYIEDNNFILRLYKEDRKKIDYSISLIED